MLVIISWNKNEKSDESLQRGAYKRENAFVTQTTYVTSLRLSCCVISEDALVCKQLRGCQLPQ